jgi:hypothetical protein
MFCEHCGNNLPDGAKFCGACGAKMEAQPAPPAPAHYPPPAYAQPYPVQPPQPQAYAPPPPPAWQAVTPLSVGEYLVTFFLMGIPLLNIILLLVWSFGSSTNANKRNLARAMLIMGVVMSIFWIIAGASMGGIFSEILSEMGSY